MLRVLAPAKLNLVLEVLGKREDGYHEIRSLVQAIDLCDILSLELARDIALDCTEPDLQTPDNLVIKAAELLREITGCREGVDIRLDKRIPWSAGLGGGSSDAAATLVALNELWRLKLTNAELIELAAKVGSDVPFFINKGMALIEGRGEKVTPLPDALSSWFVLLLPRLSQVPYKTRRLYAMLTAQHFTNGQFTDRALERWPESIEIIPSILFNVFDSIASAAFPGIEDYWRCFEQAGLDDIHLAGSGPAIFAPVDGEMRAGELCLHFWNQGITAYAVSTSTPEEE